MTLFVTTHYMDEAERCTHVGYIHNARLLVLGRPEELKKLPQVTPPGTRRYEIRVPDPTHRLRELRLREGVLDATLFGETIHLLAREDFAVRSLEEAGARVQEIPPSLEDVFVTIARAPPPPEPVAPLPPPAPPSRPRAEAVASRGLLAILRKEFAHIRREPSTLFFMLLIPLLQTVIFGYAIDTKIEHIPTVVLDLDRTGTSRRVLEAFEATRSFRIGEYATSHEAFDRALTSGRAKVGILMPADFAADVAMGRQARVQVLIDGSDSQVATTALNTTNLLGIRLSRDIGLAFAEALPRAPSRDEAGRVAVPIEMRARLLYNPDLLSSHFFVPGLVGIILQLVLLFLTSFAIVRERERGTLEQLFVTPVGRLGLLLGKLVPYAVVGVIETLIVLCAMVYLFRVPIPGSLPLLLGFSSLFIVTALALGLLVSTIARTQLEAMQFAFLVMLPSVLLSGFMFPRSEMPLPIYVLTFAIPVTYFIEILRGIVLRGADFMDLVPSAGGSSRAASSSSRSASSVSGSGSRRGGGGARGGVRSVGHYACGECRARLLHAGSRGGRADPHRAGRAASPPGPRVRA